MKKRRTSLCIMIGLCMIIAAALTACGGTKITDDMTPTQTAEAFLDTFKAQDEETMNQVYAGEGNDFLSAYEAGSNDDGIDDTIKEALMTKFYDFDYEVTGEEIAEDGETAAVDLVITTYDMKTVFNNFYQEYMGQALEKFSGSSSEVSQEEYEKLAIQVLQEQLDAATGKDFTGEARLTLTKTDGRWIVDKIGEDNDVFLNAITGGLMDVLQNVVDTREDTSGAKEDKDDAGEEAVEGASGSDKGGE